MHYGCNKHPVDHLLSNIDRCAQLCNTHKKAIKYICTSGIGKGNGGELPFALDIFLLVS